jgi:pilus assembly protein Flp/PilA
MKKRKRGARRAGVGKARTSFFREEESLVLRAFLRDERGLELSEYAVAAALITLAVIAAFTAVGTNVKGVITNLSSKIK